MLARAVTALAAAAMLLSACDVIPPELEGGYLKLQRAFNAFVAGRSGAAPRPAPSVSAGPSPSPPPASLAEAGARGAKANAELLHEIYQVVFLREPKDRAEFGSLVDSMNQGASLEGMYNGFVHSDEYRRLETAGTSASPGALKVFGEELARFESEFPTPVEFDEQGVPVKGSGADGVHVIEYGKPPRPAASPGAKPSMSPEQRAALAARYSAQFVGAPIYALKRILGDEALRVIEVKKAYPERLARWFSLWVVHMAGYKVDFGIAQRNLADESFHYQWALSAGEDRITWEVLNRVHRLLNEANRVKQ
jgi:hypothetical protein